MAKKSLKEIEKRISCLIRDLAALGPMRPGTLSVQYREPNQKKRPFHQLSYTHKGKSRSEYVRPQNVETIKKELAAYKMFKAIVEHIMDLSIKASRIRSKIPPRQ